MAREGTKTKFNAKGLKGMEFEPKKVVMTAVFFIGTVILLHLVEKIRGH